MTVYFIPPLLALGIFTVYELTKGDLEATAAFTTLSLFNTLRFPLVVLPRLYFTLYYLTLHRAIRGFAEAVAAVKRVNDFLQRPELEPLKKSKDFIGVKIKDGTFAVGSTVVLKNVNIDVQGKLVSFIGPVGSGKSVLMSSILGETKLIKGNRSFPESILIVFRRNSSRRFNCICSSNSLD